MSATRRKSNTDAVVRRMKANSAKAVSDATAAMETGVRRRVPVESGALLSTTRSATTTTGTKAVGTVSIGSPVAYYPVFVEFGTVKMRARPFFRPAAAETKARFLGNMRGVFR